MLNFNSSKAIKTTYPRDGMCLIIKINITKRYHNKGLIEPDKLNNMFANSNIYINSIGKCAGEIIKGDAVDLRRTAAPPRRRCQSFCHYLF